MTKPPPTPVNSDAEAATLGAVLLDPLAIDEIDFLEPEDFYVERNRLVLKAMRKVRNSGEPVELVSVTEVLRQQGHIARGNIDLPYLIGLGDSCPMSSKVVEYATIVRDNRLRRDLLYITKKLQQEITSTDKSVDELLTDMEQGLTGVSVSRTKPLSANYVEEAMSILDPDSHDYIRTDLAPLDKIIGGLRGLVIVGGRPSMGKSSLLRDMLRAQALRGEKVALFSQDQDGVDIYRLEASRDSGVPWNDIKTGEASEREIERWRESLLSMRTFKERFVVDDYPHNVHQLMSRIRAAVRWGATLIGVDYLQLIGVPGGKAVDFQANAQYVSKALKHLTQELRVPIVAAAQLNRGVELRANKRPMMADLRETGQIEQDANVVLFCYRQSYYEKNDNEGMEPKETDAEVIVAKQKDGPTGTARLIFDTELTTFRNPGSVR